MKAIILFAVRLVLSADEPYLEDDDQLVRALESKNLSGLSGESHHAASLEDDLGYLMAIDPNQFLAHYSESAFNFGNSNSHHTTIDDPFGRVGEVHLLSPNTVSTDSNDVKGEEDVWDLTSIERGTSLAERIRKFSKAHESILKAILLSSKTEKDKGLVFERASAYFARAGLALIGFSSFSQHKRRILSDMNLRSRYKTRASPTEEHMEILKKLILESPENRKVQLFSTANERFKEAGLEPIKFKTLYKHVSQRLGGIFKK